MRHLPTLTVTVVSIIIHVGSFAVTNPSAAQQTALVDSNNPTQSGVETTLNFQSANRVPIVSDFGGSLTLEDLQSLAISYNPTLVQAQAQINAALGAAYQAGLPPNPRVGYQGQFDQFGQAPNETWGGGFLSQEFVTGGKLRLSRAKWCQRATIARTNMRAQQRRILNDVATQFYRTLAAQRIVEISNQLLANARDNLQTNQEMLNVGQTNQPGLLRAEIDLQRGELNLRQSEYELQHAWRLLKSIASSPDLSISPLVGSLAPIEPPVDWDVALADVLSSSPEVIRAHQKIKHDQITVSRERAEPIPNITVSVSSIKNFDASMGETVLNFGIPLPVFDRNRGTIRQAQSDLAQSHAEIDRVELDLRRRLATQFRNYQIAWEKMHDFESIMLPKAKAAYDMLHASYIARRAPWSDVLMAQRLYLDLRAEQVNNIALYRESDVAIRGLLLTGGLNAPPPPIGGSHIDSVAKPR